MCKNFPSNSWSDQTFNCTFLICITFIVEVERFKRWPGYASTINIFSVYKICTYVYKATIVVTLIGNSSHTFQAFFISLLEVVWMIFFSILIKVIVKEMSIMLNIKVCLRPCLNSPTLIFRGDAMHLEYMEYTHIG